jgi:hypothetical protein
MVRFDQVAVAQIALQPQETVDPAQHVGGDARFADIAASVLVVGEMLALGARAGDQHPALALLQQLVAHEVAHVQELVLAGQAVEFRLGVAAREHDVDVAGAVAEILLPGPQRCQFDLAAIVPVRHVGGKVEIPLVARHPVEFQHSFRQPRRADQARVVTRVLRRGERPENVVRHDSRMGQRLAVART